jgi:hypothetical protein
MKSFSRILPWVLVAGLLAYLLLRVSTSTDQNPSLIIQNSVVLKEIEAMGKIELVKYNFKEITEVTDIAETYFDLFKIGPDQKIALISEGQAVGCIDLTRLQAHDILVEGDTMFIRLPQPEICYYRLDLQKTKIYSLQTNPFEDNEEFIEQAYRQAEKEIHEAAINSGILDQTRLNAEMVLKPMLQKMSGKDVVIQFGLQGRLPGSSR